MSWGWASPLLVQTVTAPIPLPRPGRAMTTWRVVLAGTVPLLVLHSLRAHRPPLVSPSRLPLTEEGMLVGRVPPIR